MFLSRIFTGVPLSKNMFKTFRSCLINHSSDKIDLTINRRQKQYSFKAIYSRW